MGFGATLLTADDVMPECMQTDAIGPAKVVFDVPADVIASAYQRFEAREELFTTKPSG